IWGAAFRLDQIERCRPGFLRCRTHLVKVPTGNFFGEIRFGTSDADKRNAHLQDERSIALRKRNKRPRFMPGCGPRLQRDLIRPGSCRSERFLELESEK